MVVYVCVCLGGGGGGGGGGLSWMLVLVASRWVLAGVGQIGMIPLPKIVLRLQQPGIDEDATVAQVLAWTPSSDVTGIVWVAGDGLLCSAAASRCA